MKPAKLSPIVFLFAILSFALPFVTVSCQRQEVARLSGLQLATGTAIHQNGPFGMPQDKQVEPVGFSYFALLCAVVGMALTVMKYRRGHLVSAALAIAACASLLLMKLMYDQEITQQGFGMVVVSYGSGFVLALLFLALGAVSSLLQYRLKENQHGYFPRPYSSPTPGVNT
jgi:hypothetical protein